MRFRDRTDAGQRLADCLLQLAGGDLIVLALPRGGVPVALEVARRLKAPLDVIGVRKLGAPGQPEFGFGAVAEDDVRVVDESSASALGLSAHDIDQVAQREREELRRRIARYRGERGLPDLAGRTVVVVDDGLATGVTARAALKAVRARNPARSILAVPVGAPETIAALEEEADEVVVVHRPASFSAVGAWYERFDQTTDQQVLDALEEAGTHTGGHEESAGGEGSGETR